MHRHDRGTLYETQILLAGWGVLVAVLFPPLYRTHPWGLAVLWLAGLGVAHVYCSMLCDDLRKFAGLPVYVWAFLLLTLVPALSLWGDFPLGALFLIIQPYLAFRLQLRAQP